MKTLIIAAGKGSRLWEKTYQLPKTLLPFGNETLLSQIMKNFSNIRISEFVLVVGFQSQLIREYLGYHDDFGLTITIIENPEWEKGNGISVYAARTLLEEDEPFLLSMSDHLVSPTALDKIKTCESDRNILLVDPRLDSIFDIEDATKVKFHGSRILAIDKGLQDFNGVDCGIFKLNAHFFQTAEERICQGYESLTELILPLIQQEQLIPCIIPDESWWLDIDTPVAYEQAFLMKDQLM